MPDQTKVVLIGPALVGKTSICDVAVNGIFTANNPSTIGGQNFTLQVSRRNGQQTVLQLWDTAGTERFRSMVPMYFRSAACCILVFDLTNESSLKELADVWIPTARAAGDESMQLILVGNKSDLEEQRVVSHERLEEFSNGIGAVLSCETSAKSRAGISGLFLDVAELAGRTATVRLPPENTDNGCCQQ
jgi:Ras-related protein Rab-5C